MALAFMIVILFTLGDPTVALSTPTGYPIIQVLYGATKSKAGTTVIMSFIIWNGMIALFSSLASVSRLTWAFARDHGLPFPEFFGYVSSTVSRNERVLIYQNLTGPSSTPHSSEFSRPCCDRHPPVTINQHRLLHCTVRYSLPLNNRIVHILRAPHYFLCPVQSSRRSYSIRPLPPWSLGSTDQRLLHRIRHLRPDLATIPALRARYGAQHELWWPCYGRCYSFCLGRLVYLGQEEVFRSCRKGWWL